MHFCIFVSQRLLHKQVVGGHFVLDHPPLLVVLEAVEGHEFKKVENPAELWR